jgi:hypothetical protein
MSSPPSFASSFHNIHHGDCSHIFLPSILACIPWHSLLQFFPGPDTNILNFLIVRTVLACGSRTHGRIIDKQLHSCYFCWQIIHINIPGPCCGESECTGGLGNLSLSRLMGQYSLLKLISSLSEKLRPWQKDKGRAMTTSTHIMFI